LYKPFTVFFILRGLGSYTARPSSRAAIKFSNRFLHCFGDRYVRLQPLTMSATRSQFGMCAGDSAMRLNGNSCNVCNACSNTSQPAFTPLDYKHKQNIITIELNNTEVQEATKRRLSMLRSPWFEGLTCPLVQQKFCENCNSICQMLFLMAPMIDK